MSGIIRCFERGTLWSKVKARTTCAIEHGAIQTIPTHSELVEQNGVKFLIRIISSLARKAQAKVDQQQSSLAAQANRNPFLPYDLDLFVADISDTHVCLLNKFNVLDYHILMVTRSFQEQESLLTLNDFEVVGYQSHEGGVVARVAAEFFTFGIRCAGEKTKGQRDAENSE